MNNFHVVTDLISGVSNLVAGGFIGSERRVTDDATVVTAEVSAVTLIDRNGGTRVLQTTSLADDVIIDRSGKTVVYLTRLAPVRGGTTPGRIASIDVATGRETEVITGLFAPANLAITSNGVSVLFTNIDTSQSSGNQLYVIGVGGGVARLIADVDQGVTVVVSGDGLVGYAASGRLVRIDLTSGDRARALNTTTDGGLSGVACRPEFSCHDRRGCGFSDAIWVRRYSADNFVWTTYPR